MSRGESAALPTFQYDDFVRRLKHYNIGAGAKDHMTDNPLFVVKEKVFDWGYDLNYTNKIAIIDHISENIFYSLNDFLQDLSDEDRKALDKVTENEVPFLDLSTNNQLDVLQNSLRYSITGYKERLQFVNCHLTKEAAERFIRVKRHSYGPLTVVVTSQKDCAEFNSLISAILNNQLREESP